MGVLEELEGGPVITVERGKAAARRMCKVPWDPGRAAITAGLNELFPDGEPAPLPELPNLVVSRVEIKPFNPQDPDGKADGFLNSYSRGGAVFTIDYETPKDEYGVGSAPGGPADKSGPGGPSGSSANQGNSNDAVFLTHKVSLASEHVLLPNRSAAWFKSADGDHLFDPGTPDDARFATGPDTKVGQIVALFTHDLTWNYVLWPPWAEMRRCIGRVNAFTIAGALHGTLLFMGVEASRDMSLTSVPQWKLGYKFVERYLGMEGTGATALPMGWNYFLRPQTGKFEYMVRKNGDPIYSFVDFEPLFTQTPVL